VMWFHIVIFLCAPFYGAPADTQSVVVSEYQTENECRAHLPEHQIVPIFDGTGNAYHFCANADQKQKEFRHDHWETVPQ